VPPSCSTRPRGGGAGGGQAGARGPAGDGAGAAGVRQGALGAGGIRHRGLAGVAVDAHTADPHYSPPPEGGALAGHNSLLLLDFSARLAPAGIYGDLTRVYFLGESVPAEIQRIAGYVFQARDAAVQLLRQRAEFSKLPSGAEVDAAARNVIANAGYGERFLHRTGHSIDHHGHATA